MLLRALLSQQHSSAESKDVVKMGMGLVATMSALVLGLLVSSAKNSYDVKNTELTENGQGRSAGGLYSRSLRGGGSFLNESRDLLRASVVRIGNLSFERVSTHFPNQSACRFEVVFDKIQALSPKDESQVGRSRRKHLPLRRVLEKRVGCSMRKEPIQ